VVLSSNDVSDASTGVIGSFTATATTDASGNFEVRLLAPTQGARDQSFTYDVLITPTDRNLGLVRDVAVLGAQPAGEVRGQSYLLPLRTSFGGVVQTADGDRVGGAQVHAFVIGGDLGGTLAPAALYARSSDASTDPTGLFDLRLDIGVYDVRIEPPASSGYPWIVERNVAIGGGPAPLSSVFEVSSPVPLTGVARWPDQSPIANAQISACALVENAGVTRSVAVAQAMTDEAGRYSLLLPPRP
jgi:hypothetical protein